MGFPTWTLWGMGLAGFGALIAIALAFIAQTPRLLNRLGLVGHRIDLRARTYTGYAFALLLLSMGFFLAGVPLGVPAGDGETAETAATAEALSEAAGQLTPETTRVLTQTITGAVMGGVSATDAPVDEAPASLDAGVAPAGSPEPVETPVISATIPLTPSTGSLPTRTPPPITETPTPFPTATLTPTPSPTVTPTPIDGETARVGDNTSVLPVNRTPGGQILATIYRGDTVIVLPGHAFHTGNTWRQISTVNGVVGWVPEQFLDYGVGAE